MGDQVVCRGNGKSDRGVPSANRPDLGARACMMQPHRDGARGRARRPAGRCAPYRRANSRHLHARSFSGGHGATAQDVSGNSHQEASARALQFGRATTLADRGCGRAVGAVRATWRCDADRRRREIFAIGTHEPFAARATRRRTTITRTGPSESRAIFLALRPRISTSAMDKRQHRDARLRPYDPREQYRGGGEQRPAKTAPPRRDSRAVRSRQRCRGHASNVGRSG